MHTPRRREYQAGDWSVGQVAKDLGPDLTETALCEWVPAEADAGRGRPPRVGERGVLSPPCQSTA